MLSNLNANKSIFLLFIPLVILIVLRIIGFDGLYGQDGYEYLRYTERLKAFFIEGIYPGNLVWPKGYLFLTTLFSFFGSISWAGQLVSLICFYGCYYFLYRSIALLYDKAVHIHLYLLPSFLLSPYLLRLSNVMMADTLAICCVLGCTYFALKYAKENSITAIVGCALFASYGCFSRYAAIVPIAPIVLWTFINWWKSAKWKHLIALIIPVLLLAVHFYFEADGSDFTGHHFIKHWDIVNLFRTDFITEPALQLPNVHYTFPNLVFYLFSFFHPGFFFPLGLLFLLSIKGWKLTLVENKSLWGIISSILLYSVFLSGITFQGNRYIALSYPLVLLLFYPSYLHGLEKVGKHKMLIVALLVVVQLSLYYRALLPSFRMNLLERELTTRLEEYEGQQLYSFQVDIALQGRKMNFEYYSLWEKEYDQFHSGALVLFNEPYISSRFMNKNPMKNWEKLNKENNLHLVKELSQGWNLYQIGK